LEQDMPGKPHNHHRSHTNFHASHRRQRDTAAGHAASTGACHASAQNVVTFHRCNAVRPTPTAGTAPLPLRQSAVVLHTDLECLPIAIVASILWPCMNEIPQTWPIRNFNDFYEALADWGELESQAVEDAHNFLRLQEPGRRVAWASQLEAHAQFTDYRVAGLYGHWSNQFWVRRLGMRWTWAGLLAPEGERQLESLRVSMQVIMLRLFPVSMREHLELLEALESIEEGKGIPDAQRAQENARALGITGVTFTYPSYPPAARNSIRMHILASAAQALVARYPEPLPSGR
jgi:hypothetical protein